MAIYNLHVSHSKGRSVVEKANYICREEKYSHLKDDKYDDFIYSENINMPSFAIDNPKAFWESAELYERENANIFREIEFSIPHELNDEERIEVATEFVKKIFKDEYVYSLAIHNKKSSVEDIDNVHCHIIFSERKLDGIDRDKEKFFKRYNSKNPSLGGCKKIDWSRKHLLYDIRQEWEKTANKYLAKYNTNITSLSLEKQRLNALLEENYLKAEMLDRDRININFQTYKYSYNSEYRTSYIEYFEECKKIKAYKEELYKLRCENFEEENEKAKQRFLNGEVEKMDFSTFDVENKETINQDTLQQVHQVVNHIIENNISILKNNRKIEELNNISEIDIEENAFNILTNNEYSEKLIRLNKLEDFYDRTPIKENFIYKEEMKSLNNYFIELARDKELQKKVFSLKEKIIEDNKEIIRTLSAKNNELKIDNSLENNIETRKILEKNFDKLITTSKELEKVKNDISILKTVELNRDNILLDIYKNMNKEDIIQKYKDITRWKKELESTTDNIHKEELIKNIKAREVAFIKYNLVNEIDVKLDSIVEQRKKELSKLLEKKNQLEDTLKVTNDLLTNHSDYISTGTRKDIKEIIQEYNYENIFKTSIDIEVLANRKEERIKQIQSITNEDIENRVLNILTKNEFSKNLKELNRLEEFYENTPIKENFAYKERKAELEKYFKDLNKNEFFQNKLNRMKVNIKEKYQIEKDKIGEELKNLRNNQYRDIHNKINPESTVLTKIIQRESLNTLSDLYEKSNLINRKVKDYKPKLEEKNILLDIYKSLDKPNVIEKYEELEKWRKELEKTTDDTYKEELHKNIKARETSFMKFNIANHINEKLDEILKNRRAEYKDLRQEQDDIQGKIKYLNDINKVLKEKLKETYIQETNMLKLEYNILEKEDSSKDILPINKLYNKLLYNSKVEDLEVASKEKLSTLENNRFKVELNNSERKELTEMIVKNINTLVEENKILEKETNLQILKDEKSLERYILDSKTNNEYSKELNRVEFYEKQINKKIDVKYHEKLITETQERINLLIKNNPITANERSKFKAEVRSKSISSIAKVHTNKKQIRLLYSTLKKVNSDNVKVTDLIGIALDKLTKFANKIPKEYNYDKKLYVLGVDRVVIEEEDVIEKERRKILRRNSYER